MTSSFGCLGLVLYGIRGLAEQHYEQSQLMRSKHCGLWTNESGEHCSPSSLRLLPVCRTKRSISEVAGQLLVLVALKSPYLCHNLLLNCPPPSRPATHWPLKPINHKHQSRPPVVRPALQLHSITYLYPPILTISVIMSCLLC